MKVIIAGSRTVPVNVAQIDRLETSLLQRGFRWPLYFPASVATALVSCPADRLITEVVCGMADGADLLGLEWALRRGVPHQDFPIDRSTSVHVGEPDGWQRWGKVAAHYRNCAMAGYADALVAVWDGRSTGTKHMIDVMKWLGKPTHVYTLEV